MWPFKKKKSVNQNNLIDSDFGRALNASIWEHLREQQQLIYKMDNNIRSFIKDVAHDVATLERAVLNLQEKSELLEELRNEASNKKSKSRTKHKNTRRNAAVGTKSTGTKSAN